MVTDDAVMVMMDMPGLEADDLEIELQDDLLTVRGDRELPHAGDLEARAWQRIERGFGKFERTLQVPRGLDPDAIEASLDAGVLTLRIAKPEQLRPQRVQIGAAGPRKRGSSQAQAPHRPAEASVSSAMKGYRPAG